MEYLLLTHKGKKLFDEIFIKHAEYITSNISAIIKEAWAFASRKKFFSQK
ncbi:MAG: hypothetical protein ABIK27_02915 [Bacteroidota bacterium]